MCTRYIGKGRDLYIAFMYLEKAYDKIDKNVMWQVLLACGVGRKLLKVIKGLYNESKQRRQ